MHNKSRLKIWVCEFVSAGGLVAEVLPASLLQEGLLMRDALLADLHALGVDCITSHDRRVPAPEHAMSVPVGPGDDVATLWQAQFSSPDIDACWVIAPETGGLLAEMAQRIAAAGKLWVGCSASAIRDTTSKSRMADLCAAAGIQGLPHRFLNTVALEGDPEFAQLAQAGWVVKPDDGAGCESTFHFKNNSQLTDFIIKNKELISSGNLLLQPYVPGQALSMSVLSTTSKVQVVAAHRQVIACDAGAIRFEGADVNAATAYLPQMQLLAEQIHAAIPGLLGYWGADLILDADARLHLVEINPRLTTPYMALASLMDENPAELILQCMLNDTLTPALAHRSLSLRVPAVKPAKECAA